MALRVQVDLTSSGHGLSRGRGSTDAERSDFSELASEKGSQEVLPVSEVGQRDTPSDENEHTGATDSPSEHIKSGDGETVWARAVVGSSRGGIALDLFDETLFESIRVFLQVEEHDQVENVHEGEQRDENENVDIL